MTATDTAVTPSALWFVASLALICVGAATWAMGHWLAAATVRIVSARAKSRLARRLPMLLRCALPLAVALGTWMGPRLPLRARVTVHAWLRHAELDDELAAHDFIALGAVWATFSAALLIGLPTFGGVLPLLAVLALVSPWVWLRDAMRRRDWEILRDLPLYMDLLTLALEAGGALSVALRVATDKVPDSALRRALVRLQGDLRAGRSRVDALQAFGERLDTPAVAPLVAAMVQAETRGGSLAAVLRAQSEQRLNERFARAEKLALEAPVKMLGPLILCIFPCTFIVLAFPVAMRLLHQTGSP